MTNRIKWKDEQAQKRYNSSYVSLCSDRKKIIDQLWILNEMEKEDKNRGCR
jgi:hypothetical protein